MGKPFPARSMAALATSPKVMVPYRESAVIHASAAAGVSDASTPTGILPPWFFWKYSMDAALGHTPRPSMVTTSLRSARWITVGATPRKLQSSTCTTFSAMPTATPASTALPPRLRISRPAMAALGWLAATIPLTPCISGR